MKDKLTFEKLLYFEISFQKGVIYLYKLLSIMYVQ